MSIQDKYIGQKVIVRCDKSGVFFGTLAEREGQECVLRDVRCLWYWDGAATLLQMAEEGVKNPQNCNFTVSVEELVIIDAVEILPCTDTAIRSIESVDVWKA